MPCVAARDDSHARRRIAARRVRVSRDVPRHPAPARLPARVLATITSCTSPSRRSRWAERSRRRSLPGSPASGCARAGRRAAGGGPAWRIAGTGIAVVLVVVWMLPAVNFERTIAGANESITEHMPSWPDEAFAPLNGHFPLVDYVAQYASLWPYPVAGLMALLGPSLGVFTIAVSAIGALTMLAVFSTFRRVARSTAVGLVLFLPFLATSLFTMRGPLENRYAVMNLFGTFPLRYAGRSCSCGCWLDSSTERRHADCGPCSSRPASWSSTTSTSASRRSARRSPRCSGRRAHVRRAAGALGARSGGGACGGARAHERPDARVAGSLPHLELLGRFARYFALAGFGAMPMTPAIGMSTVVNLTYVAAIGVATIRAADGEPDRLMTGLSPGAVSSVWASAATTWDARTPRSSRTCSRRGR